MTEISILNNTTERKILFKSLYLKTFPVVARYISRRGGTYEEAKDIFQDALVIYYEKLSSEKLVVTNNEKTYILGIAKYLWYKRYKATNNILPLDSMEVEETSDAEKLSSGKLFELIETAGKRCLDMLRDFYYEKLSIAEIASKFGYSGIRSATVQKYKCLEKIRNTIQNKSLSYEDFLE